MATVTFTDLRANMARHFDQVEAQRHELVVTRQNHEALAVLPLAELDALRQALAHVSPPAVTEQLLRSASRTDHGFATEEQISKAEAASDAFRRSLATADLAKLDAALDATEQP
jgi:antitoxin YefM